MRFFGGVDEIGGNKVLVEDKGTKVFFDFGQSFGFGAGFFTGWLAPRQVNGLGDYFEFGLLPKISGLYAEGQLENTALAYCEPEIAAVFLSHGHFDHGNGLRYLEKKTLVCHPECFIKRYRKSDSRLKPWLESQFRWEGYPFEFTST